MSRFEPSHAPRSARRLAGAGTPSILLFALAWLCAAGPAKAAIVEWANPSSGSWTDAANWSPVGVPGGGDDARITVNTSPYDVRLQLTTRSANSVHVNASNARLLLEGGTLNVATGVTVGAGSLSLSNSGSPQSLLNAQSLSIAGGAIASVTRSNLATSVTNMGDLTLNFLHMSNVDGAGGTATFANDGTTRMLGSGLASPSSTTW